MKRIGIAIVIRALLVLVSAGSIWVTGLFAFTDRAWVLMGSPPEVYPELLYLFVGLPLAIASLGGFGCSLGARFLGHPHRRLDQIVSLLALAALLGSLWLIGLAFVPEAGQQAHPLPRVVSNVITLTPIPLMIVEIGLGLQLISISLRKRLDAASSSRLFLEPLDDQMSAMGGSGHSPGRPTNHDWLLFCRVTCAAIISRRGPLRFKRHFVSASREA